MRQWDQENNRIATTEADPVNPRRVFTTLNDKLSDNAIITCDAGSTADWYGFRINLGRNQMGNLSGRIASMLRAMPYAIAGKFAYPDRPVVATIGDRAFQMMGINGLLTIKRHWQEWDNHTFIVLVLDNGDLNQTSWEMRIAGDPRWDTAQLVEPMDYAGYAELLGLKGIRVDDPGDLDRNLVPRDHGSMSTTSSQRSAFEKARAKELAEHQREVNRLQDQIRNLEGSK